MNNKILDGIKKDLKKIPDLFRGNDGKIDVKKLLIEVAPYLIAAYVANKVSYGYHISPGADFWEKGMNLCNDFGKCFGWPPISIFRTDLLIGLIAGGGLKLFVWYRKKNAKKFRKGQEFGSSRWGTAKDIRPFMDPVFERNIILTQTERLMMSSRPANPECARNKNVLVIGGSGSGKTRFFVKPNLMQMNCSFVVTDPKATILLECGKMLQRGAPKLDKNGNPMRDKKGNIIYQPYKIKIFNTINFRKSMHYNPFAYIHSEKDILKFVNALIANTKGEGDKEGEDFWVKAEKLYYTALISYIYYEAPEEEQNFSMLLDLIDASEAREEDEDFKNAVDLLFDELEEKNPNHFALRQYQKYKLAAGKTAKSILISCGARLAPFDIKELREITEYDELELDMIGDERTALFVLISDTDSTFNFLVSIMYTQLFNLLCERADDYYHGRLPIHVRFLLDEFANIGQIPHFDKLIATIRSREISASIILQSKSQLKAIYKDNAETITGNCDSTIFLGGNEKTTLKDLEEMIGKETIDYITTNDQRGQSQTYTTNYNMTGKFLMSQDELSVMSRKKCILQINGLRPFFSDKYDITKHKNYELLSDYDKKNEFDMEKYVRSYHKAKITPETKVTVIQAN